MNIYHFLHTLLLEKYHLRNEHQRKCLRLGAPNINIKLVFLCQHILKQLVA